MNLPVLEWHEPCGRLPTGYEGSYDATGGRSLTQIRGELAERWSRRPTAHAELKTLESTGRIRRVWRRLHRLLTGRGTGL